MDSHLDSRSVHAMLGVFWFPEFSQDTEPCTTQIVVSSIVHETQTQNYNVTVFRSFAIREQTKKVWIPKYSIYTTLHKFCTSSVVRVVKSHDRYIVCCVFDTHCDQNFLMTQQRYLLGCSFCPTWVYLLGSAKGLRASKS